MVFPLSLRAQIAWCSPNEVRWGDTVKIYYNPSATNATLTLRDEVYAMLSLSMWNGSKKDTIVKAVLQKNMFVATYHVEDSLSSAYFNVITPEKSGNAGDDFLALRRDSVFARGAVISKIWDDSTAFAREIALYPDNLSAFLEKWKYLEYVGQTVKQAEESILQEEVCNDLKQFTSTSKNSAEFWAAQAAAYSILGDKHTQRTILKRLGKDFPTSPYTAQALEDYIAKDHRGKIKDSLGYEIRALVRSMIEKFPSSLAAKEGIERNVTDSLITLSMAKPVINDWIQKEPWNLDPYLRYIQLAKRSNNVSDTVSLFAAKIMDKAMDKEVRMMSHLLDPGHTADYYHYAAQGFELCGQYGQALASLQAAENAAHESESKGYYSFQQGLIYKKCGLYNSAENTFIIASAANIKGAKDSALAVYKHLRGTDSGFATFIKQKTDSILAAKAKPALPFTVKALDGKTYDIAKLKGKAVVLNFWFIGCPPCRQEIPGLNTLVKEYAKKDVVFLALALDDEKSLNDFLKKTPFTYTIVPKAQNVSELYGVEGFPTHVILDRKGMNIGQLVGGSETRHEDLRPLIERALGQ